MTLDPRLLPSDTFVHRHLGPSDAEVAAMLAALGLSSLDELMAQTVPDAIQLGRRLDLGPPRGEHELLAELKGIASRNVVARSLIGMGYYDTIVPPVIQRNILENPGWYTQYTPYQAEIAQGRLEALINFQTMVADLCGMPLANASVLDEATAAAEAMNMAWNIARTRKLGFFVAETCHPQTIAVLQTRAEPLGIQVHVGDPETADFVGQDLFGILVQYPDTNGTVSDFRALTERAHAAKATVTVASDLLALTLLEPPGAWGADIVVGSSQRFGVPLGYGGPHAGFMATHEDHVRKMPGRLIGVSRDAQGNAGYRLAVQTREQHIRRDKATSNICTAQVLLAIMASMYGVYHGPDGLTAIARRVRGWTTVLADGLRRLGHDVRTGVSFDTLRVSPAHGDPFAAAAAAGMNLRRFDGGDVGISLDEKTDAAELEALLAAFAGDREPPRLDSLTPAFDMPGAFARTVPFLTHPVFHQHRSEHEMLRYLYRLQQRDLSLATSMIPLGSCTMKLNGTVEMVPVTWPEFASIHPFAPREQAAGYTHLFDTLQAWLAEITGFAAVSLQPNAGSQGEYAGLLVIRAYHRSRGDTQRDVCLIPTSAHGTNPASAVMAGMRVVTVACDERGNVDLDDLRARAAEHADRLAALMITYPSTHGVFEAGVREVCRVVHQHGGQVYMDGANMNAQVGFTNPANIGADVCHLNLHKTFCIPHGGGGPGMGPIGVVEHLAPFLPGHPVIPCGGERAIGPVSAAPWGSPAILPISWVYIALMGEEGLRKATATAVLNANYMAARLSEHYEILYRGANGRVAHEFIVDCRMFKAHGVAVDDIAKRLMDYGFHAPTMSFPVPGTLMIEPTESEAKGELDRFCDAMVRIRQEIRDVAEGRVPEGQSPLNHAPHTAAVVCGDTWDRPYGREEAAFPAPWVRERKFWPAVGRIDNAYGDRNLICSCPPLEDYSEA
jgi:glycine dehydrogenase